MALLVFVVFQRFTSYSCFCDIDRDLYSLSKHKFCNKSVKIYFILDTITMLNTAAYTLPFPLVTSEVQLDNYWSKT